MLHAQGGQNSVHGRHRSVSPLSRRVSAPLRSGSLHTGSGSNGAAASSGAPQPARSSRRGRGGLTRAAAAGHHHMGPSTSSSSSSSGAGMGPASSSHRSRMSDPGVHNATASSRSYSHGLPPRSRTPPPLRAVAMPLDPQVLNPDTDFSLDLVKVQFKCTYATSFGQELRVVGGAPELGAWDLAQAPVMTWNNGHVWMMNAFLPPGTYPFKVVVYTPAARPEAARWENGPNRSITIDANSPELGPAALVLVECQFDSTQHTNTQTKRIGTGIGFKATNLTSNRHLSTDLNGNGAGPAQLPSAQAMANAGSSSAADSSYRASMLAAAGIPTSKVTARLPDPNAAPPVPQQVSYQQEQPAVQQPQQFYQQPAVQQQEPQHQHQQHHQHQHEPAAAAAAPADSAEQHMPGTEAFNTRIADLDSRLAALLARNGKQPPAAAANNIVGAPAAASVVVPAPPQPSSPPAAAAAPAPAAAGPVPAGLSAAVHQAPPEVQAAAAVCKEDPGAADACRVVTKFISEHLEMIESQALEMMKHNERLEQRMAALEQHTQDYDDNIMQALADSLVLAPEDDLQQQLPPAPAVPKPAAVPATAHAAPSAVGAAATGSNGVVKASTAAAAAAAAAAGAPASAAPVTDAADLVRSFMANFGSGSMLSAGQRPASAEPLAPAADFSSPLGSGPVVLGDDDIIDISASVEELLKQQEKEQEQEVAAAAVEEQQQQQQQHVHAHAAAEVLGPAATAWQHTQEQQEQHHEQHVPVQHHEQHVPVQHHEQHVPAEHHEQHVPAEHHEQHVPAEHHEQQLHAEHPHQQQQQDHEHHQGLFVSGHGNGSSAQAFAAALDSTTPAGFSVDAAAAFVDSLPVISTGPQVAFRSEDPNWQAAHARALQWATNQVEPEWDEEEEEEDEEVPWWLKDNLPAARKTPTPIGAASDRLASPPSSPTSSSRLRWSRARFTAPGHVLTADQLLQDEEEGEEGEQDEEGRSLRRPTAAQSAFSGSAVTLATATPATAAAAAAAAAASPLVQNLQQHAYKAAKAFGQSEQAAAIAATAIASRVAFGCDPEEAAATITSPRRRRHRSSSGSNGSAAGGSSAEQGTIAGAMAAAVRTRQQVLAVTDLAAQLTAAGDMTGASGPPELGAQGGLDTGVAGFDPRPESLVPTVTAGPFQLADDVLVLPSAQQIAAGTYQQQHGEGLAAVAEVLEDGALSSSAGSSSSDGDEADAASDAELLQLAALQQENLMLSELASLHTRVIGLHEQAMKLEKEAHAEMEAGLSDSATTSSSFDDFETEGSDSDGEADGVGGVLGLAFKTAEKRNGRSHKHDASAVKKLMAAVQLRMEAALLQKEASEKRRALNAMRTAAASASAATFDRHWQPAAVEAAQQQVQEEDEEDSWSSEDDSGSDDGDGGSSSGGGYGGGGGGGSGNSSSLLEPVPVAAGATATMAAAMAVAAPAAAAPAPWGTLEVQPVALTALRAAMAAPPTAAAAVEQAPHLPRARPMATPAAAARDSSGADTHSSRAAAASALKAHAAPLELPQHSGRGPAASGVQHAAPAAAAPVLTTATESSSRAPAPAATAVAADVQEDMQAMRSKIAELQRKVVSRKSQLSALMGGASPAAVAAMAAAHSAGSADSSGSAASILGAAAAAAAATAVAAAVPAVAPPPATPTVMEQQQSGGDVSVQLQGRSEVNGRAVPALKSVAVAAGGAAATAAAGSAAANSPRGARFASRVLDSPALVSSAASGSMDGFQSIYAGSSGCVRQDRLAELQARTAAAVAAREQLSAQAAEAQQALAAISSSRQAAAAAAAAAVGAAAGAVVAAKSAAPATGSADDSSSCKAEMLSQRAEVAAKAVEALSQWEDQAATAKQSLADLEQQAAAALAELEAHEAARQTGQVLRQQMMAQHRTQQVAYGWQQPGGPVLVPASSVGASARPAGVAPMVSGGGLVMDIVAEGLQTSYVAAVPDPAAAAVITSLAAVTAVQAAAGQILHDTWHM